MRTSKELAMVKETFEKCKLCSTAMNDQKVQELVKIVTSMIRYMNAYSKRSKWNK